VFAGIAWASDPEEQQPKITVPLRTLFAVTQGGHCAMIDVRKANLRDSQIALAH